MYSLMFQFRHRGDPPTLDSVRSAYGLVGGDVDEAFGVVATDQAEGLYVVLLTPLAARQVEAALARSPRDPAVGVFSNPRVEPMGDGGTGSFGPV